MKQNGRSRWKLTRIDIAICALIVLATGLSGAIHLQREAAAKRLAQQRYLEDFSRRTKSVIEEALKQTPHPPVMLQMPPTKTE
jgi:hypothetical protein